MESHGNPYGAEAAELSYLLTKPPCFIVLGEPGTGALTLATGLVNARGCVLIEAEEVISRNIATKTQTGLKLQEALLKGQSVSQKEVVELLTETASSSEVAYYGYVLCGFPSLSEDYLKIEEQIKLIKSWPLKPSLIINIKCPDGDVLLRQVEQRVDPTTGVSYTKQQWNSPKLSNSTLTGNLEDAEDEILLNETSQVPPKEVLQRLIKNPEAFLENVQQCLQMHKDRMQRPLKTFLAEHGHGHMIDVDGNQQPEAVLVAVLEWLDLIGVRHVVSPLHLELPPECFLEDMAMADMLNVLSQSHNVAPGCRWQLSRWGVVCPVALYHGSIIHGKPELAVGFLDKMYMLSSEEVMKEFVCNPSVYLMPPQPRPPCKVLVCGPPSSGKSTLCHTLGQTYNAQVVDVISLLKQRLQEQMLMLREKATQEAAEEAIVGLNTKQLSEDLGVTQCYCDNTFVLFCHMAKTGIDLLAIPKVTEDVKIDVSQDLPRIIEEMNSNPSIIMKDEDINDFMEVDASLQSSVSDDDQFEVTKTTNELLLSFPAQTYMEMLEEALLQLRHSTQDSLLEPGAIPSNGWVLEVPPLSPEYWFAMLDGGFSPNTVFCLRDTSEGNNFLLSRLYHMNKEMIDNSVSKRIAEKQITEQTAKEMRLQNLATLHEKELRETEKTENGLQPKEKEEQGQEKCAEALDDIVGVSVPEFSKYDFPDAPEMEHYRQEVKAFEMDWEIFYVAIKDVSTICPNVLDIAWKTSMELADEALQSMKKMFDFKVTIVSTMELELEKDEEEEYEDYDDESNDYEFEHESDEKLENEEQKSEWLAKVFRRQYGDTKHYCPVALKNNFVLIPGSTEAAATYRGNLYLCSDSKAQDMFLSNPQFYVGGDKPLQAPPIRVFLLNALGAGKGLHGRWLATKLGCFHLQFRARLQELLLPKLGYRVGDDQVEQDHHGVPSKLGPGETIGGGGGGVSGGERGEEEVETPQNAETALTEEEQSILRFLEKGKPLSVCDLDNIILAWWNEEPFRSCGFVLDGFPSTTDDVQYIVVKELFPDIVIVITATEEDVIECLLPDRLEKFRIQTAAKLQKRKTEHSTSDKDEETIEAVDSEEEDGVMEMEEETFIQIKDDILEKFEENLFLLEEMQSQLEEMRIPVISVDGSQKTKVCQHELYKNFKHLKEDRENLFESCCIVHETLAFKMLQNSYRFLSSFGMRDPVKVFQGEIVPRLQSSLGPIFPVLHRHFIYFLSTKETCEQFLANTIRYVNQAKPRLLVPVTVVILGPPKSGKTTVATRLARDYGLRKISAEDSVCAVVDNARNLTLASEIKWHLHRGQTLPDALVIQAIKVALLDVICQTRGYIVDGYPMTLKQFNLMVAHGIIPLKVIELQLDAEALKRRMAVSQHSIDLLHPDNEGPEILALKSMCYSEHMASIRDSCEHRFQNWQEIDAGRSKWWVWEHVLDVLMNAASQLQVYVENLNHGWAACVFGLCLTAEECKARLGQFGSYCPVSLALHGELVCTPSPSMRFVAEFKGHFYKMASQEALQMFLTEPEAYTSADILRRLPPADLLPAHLEVTKALHLLKTDVELDGFCPVTYRDGKERTECLLPGNINHAVKYRNKVYMCHAEEAMDKFLRLPEVYSSVTLPKKLPPKKEPLVLTALPVLGYLEQSVGKALTQALTLVGTVKPKLPLVSIKRSALLYTACTLKAFNVQSEHFVREKYAAELKKMEEYSDLIVYLGLKVTHDKEPWEQPHDVHQKMEELLARKRNPPVF